MKLREKKLQEVKIAGHNNNTGHEGWGSHFMLGRTFYVTFIPVTVCKCQIELKATWLDLTWIDISGHETARERPYDFSLFTYT